MLGALLPALAIGLNAYSGYKEKQNQLEEDQAKAAAKSQAEDRSFIQKMATDRANEGDPEWFAQNQAHLEQHMSPAVLNALISHSENQNSRLFDADPTSVQLSPFNQRIRAMKSGSTSDISHLISGLNQQMSDTPMEQRGSRPYQDMLAQRGQLIDSESQRTPGVLAPETQSIHDVNNRLESALNDNGEASAQPARMPVPSATPTPALQVPPARQASSRVLKTSIGSITQQVPGTTGKEVLSSLLSQTQANGQHPNEALKAFNQENLRRMQAGQPALDFDEAGMKSAREQHWEQMRAQIQANLQSNGVDPQQAFIQSAQITMQQDPNVPDRWMQYLKPDPQRQAEQAYATAATQAGDMIKTRVQAMQSPTAKNVKPQDLVQEPFLLQAVNSVPGLGPEQHTRILHELASTAHQAFLTAAEQQHPELDPQQQNYLAMSLASKATGGNVPPQWRAFVEKDMKGLFNLTDSQMHAYAALSPFQRPDPLSNDFRSRLSAAQTQMENNADVRKAFLGNIKTPEGVMAAAPAMNSTDALGGLKSQDMRNAGSAAGRTDRGIQLGQEGALKQQAADVERKNAIMPTAHMEKLQTADSIYKAGREAQQLAARKDKNGQTIIDKYGDTPGSFRDFWSKIKEGVGRADPSLVAYKNRLAKVYNFERHELTGAATSVYEGSALEPYLPNPGDNVRTGLMKLNNLVQQMGGQLDQKLDQAKADYPRSKHELFYRNQERQKQSVDDVFGEAKKRLGK